MTTTETTTMTLAEINARHRQLEKLIDSSTLWTRTCEIAKRVLFYAERASASARFCGGGRVYISYLACEMQLPLNEVKKYLVAAHRCGKLELARIDMPAAGDAEQIRASETRLLESEWHAVVDPTAA